MTRPELIRALRRWCLDLEVDAYAKSLLHVLVQYVNANGECHPSLERIAREAGMSVRKARNVIKELEVSGHLEVRRSAGRLSNVYRILHERDRSSRNTSSNPAPCAESKTSSDWSHSIRQPGTQGSVERDANAVRPVSQPGTRGIPTRPTVPPIGNERESRGDQPTEPSPEVLPHGGGMTLARRGGA
ncbi:MAG: helix-turn-helix domain-containing protein [Gammaproteobacteria bacterium]